jgi:hypothetical protein
MIINIQSIVHIKDTDDCFFLQNIITKLGGGLRKVKDTTLSCSPYRVWKNKSWISSKQTAYKYFNYYRWSGAQKNT